MQDWLVVSPPHRRGHRGRITRQGCCKMKNVLVLCTGNSARSILGEALINQLGKGRLRGFSAGSDPRPAPHPAALTLLAAKGYDVSAFSSKRWDVFAGPDAPVMDIVITVCDNAAGEACPVWPGAPVSAHWGIEDPAAAAPEYQAAAFRKAHDALAERVEAMLALDLEGLAPAELRSALNAIGARSSGATALASGGGW
ncbi:MAG: arsenate reductase ArsC [Nitratireductor sp.]|nr:arsenate reductase ArsC [Nitratireductor sp.]